jgi:ribosomal protein S13
LLGLFRVYTLPKGVVNVSGVSGVGDLLKSQDEISRNGAKHRIKQAKIDLEPEIHLNIKLLIDADIYKGTKLHKGLKMKKLR